LQYGADGAAQPGAASASRIGQRLWAGFGVPAPCLTAAPRAKDGGITLVVRMLAAPGADISSAYFCVQQAAPTSCHAGPCADFLRPVSENRRRKCQHKPSGKSAGPGTRGRAKNTFRAALVMVPDRPHMKESEENFSSHHQGAQMSTDTPGRIGPPVVYLTPEFSGPAVPGQDARQADVAKCRKLRRAEMVLLREAAITRWDDDGGAPFAPSGALCWQQFYRGLGAGYLLRPRVIVDFRLR
jgi:hypothetical protein